LYGQEVAEAQPGAQVVAHISMCPVDGGLHDRDAFRLAVQARGDGAGVDDSRRVPVGDDHHVRFAQHLGVFPAPLRALPILGRAVEVAGSRVPYGRQPVGVLLAFHDVNGVPGFHRGEHLRQPVQDPAGVAELKGPVAVAVRPLDREVLRLEADFDEQQLAVLIGVAILGGDPPRCPVTRLARLVEQVREAKLQRRQHGRLRIASGLAPDHRAGVALGDGQACRPVIVVIGWALGHPRVGAALLDTAAVVDERGCHARDCWAGHAAVP
jgi:hypothetical protein